MRDGQVIIGPDPARPHQDVEIERPRLPGTSSPDTTEMEFYIEQPTQ